MLRFNPARAVGIVSCAAFALAPTPEQVTSPGVSFDVVTTSSSQAAGAPVFKMTAHAMAAANGSARMDVMSVEGAAGAVYAVGDYFVTLEGRSVLVRVASKTYVDVLDQATNAMNNMPPEIRAQMSISGISGTSEKISGSEPIEGRPTDHHRTVVNYSMSIMGQTIPTTITSDYWITKLPVKFVNPMAGGAKSSITTGPMAELARKQAELAPPMGDGAAAIKAVIVTSAALMGQTIATTITTEMKNIKDADVDAALFVIPAGYTKAAK